MCMPAASRARRHRRHAAFGRDDVRKMEYLRDREDWLRR
jgi:hypothetical protein